MYITDAKRGGGTEILATAWPRTVCVVEAARR